MRRSLIAALILSSASAHAQEEVVVRGTPQPRREVVDYAVRAERGKEIAGTEGDPVEVVHDLPGVARAPAASGQIVVWGSAAKDTRLYVDGVEVPALYHGSGLRSTLNSDLVGSIDLVPGGFGAEYGRALGGIVRVDTRALPPGQHGYVGADTLDGSTFVATSLNDRIRASFGLRYGWLDRLLPLTSAPDVGDFFPIPRYRDAQIKATFDLRRHETLDTVFLYSSDSIERTAASADPAKRRTDTSSLDYWRAYARYVALADDGTATIVTPFVGHDASSVAQRFGETPDRLAIDSTRYGVRGSVKTPLGRGIALLTGLDALGTVSKLAREGSATIPPREGDVTVFGQPPGDDYAVDTWRTHILDVAPNVSSDIALGPVVLTPSIRFDAFLIEGSAKNTTTGNLPPLGFTRLETAVAPRASVRWRVDDRLALLGAWGTYHQAPDPEELSAVFGTPDLGLARATHLVVGESLRIRDSLTLDVVGFDKRMSDLVVRSRLANPPRARALVQNGEGHGYGVSFTLRQEPWKGFSGWATYTISRSERRYDDETTWRRFDFDQPHVLALVANQQVLKFNFGARFRYASGDPRTAVTRNVYDAHDDRFDPVFGDHNGIRIPSFWQFDLRVDRRWVLPHDVAALVYVDLQNVTNHRNAEEIVYSSDFRRQSVITGLPFVAVLGGRLEL